MLVLSRKVGERIHIGDEIVVTVVDVRGGYVKLGFEAPLEISIRREEVQQRFEREFAGANQPRRRWPA